MLPQNVTEQLLVDALARRAGRVEYETTLVSAVDRGDGVCATVEHAGRRTTWISLTPTGRAALRGHVAALRALIADVE